MRTLLSYLLLPSLGLERSGREVLYLVSSQDDSDGAISAPSYGGATETELRSILRRRDRTALDLTQ